MAAPRGNKNAKGNSGGKPWMERKKISTFKGLVLNYAIRVMRQGTKEEKKVLVQRAITSVLPRPIELGGEGGEPIIVKIIKEK